MNEDKSLSRVVSDGVAWMLALRLSVRALGFVNTIVLARLLTPEDFGTVAIAMSMFALFLIFTEFGFDTVIIQLRQATRDHYDTAWTFNVLLGVLLALLLAGLSVPIARFYENQNLVTLTRVVAVLFLIGGLRNVGVLDFQKNLTFDKEFYLNIFPKLVGVPLTIILAYWLRNYWALTLGTIITQLVSISTGYWMHRYRPRFSFGASRELFSFSKWLMISNLFNFVNNRSPEIVIGKVLNMQATGYYSIANDIATMTTSEASAAVSRASYPGYAQVADNTSELVDLYMKVIGSTALALIPMSIGVTCISEFLVPVFLGDQWLPSIALIELIAISGLFSGLNSNAGYLFMAIGRPQISTIFGAIRILIFVPSMIYLLNIMGLVGAAWAILFTTIVMFILAIAVVMYNFPIKLIDYLQLLYRPLIGSAIMATSVTWSIFVLQLSRFNVTLFELLSVVLIGTFSYLVTLFILWQIGGKRNSLEKQIAANIWSRIRKQFVASE